MNTIKALQDGAIGDIVLARVYWNGTKPWVRERKEGMSELEYQVHNWYQFLWTCGDHIVEQHIHNIDVANWILGSHPVSAIGMGGRAFQKGPDSGEIFDHHAVQFEYAVNDRKVRVFSECRQIPGCWNAVSEHVHGTKGACDFEGRGLTITGCY